MSMVIAICIGCLVVTVVSTVIAMIVNIIISDSATTVIIIIITTNLSGPQGSFFLWCRSWHQQVQ